MVSVGRNPLLQVIYETDLMEGTNGFADYWRFREPNTEETLLKSLRFQLENSGRTDVEFLKAFMNHVSVQYTSKSSATQFAKNCQVH